MGGPQPGTPGGSAPTQDSTGSCHLCPLLGLWPGPCHVQPGSVGCLHSCAEQGGREDLVHGVRGEATSLRRPSAGVSAACARLPFKSRVLKYPRGPGAVPGGTLGLCGIRAACSWQPQGSGHAASWWHSAVPSSHGPSVRELPLRWPCRGTPVCARWVARVALQILVHWCWWPCVAGTRPPAAACWGWALALGLGGGAGTGVGTRHWAGH